MQIDVVGGALGGQYQLRPGLRPGVVGQRPVLSGGRLGRLLRGQRDAQVSATLSSIFTLCAHAHRRTAALALASASDQDQVVAPIEPPVLLWIETARDHLRSIALEWPQRLPNPPADHQIMDWLRDCPLPLVMAHPHADSAAAWQTLAALRAWLEQRVLGQPVAHWLAAHRDPAALALWCQAQGARLPPARCLAAWYCVAHTLTPETRYLELLDEDIGRQTTQLRQLAQTLLDEPDFVQRPTWLGHCAETGPWARLRHRQEQVPPQHSAWTRLGARWIELLEIAAAEPFVVSPGKAPLLASGALALGTGQALAWSEMARGLLLHWVQLDAHDRVQDYRVLAPTEWNFHPDGALAHTVAALAPDATLAARMLAAAFDPCVACTIQTPVTKETPGE